MQLTCINCKRPVEVPDPPPSRIINGANVSMVMAEHFEQGFCPTCQVPVTVVVLQCNLVLAAVPVPPKEQKPIVLAPNGMRLN